MSAVLLKRTLVTLAAIGLTGAAVVSVNAADLPAKAASPAQVVATGWTGFYVGFHGGYGWGDAQRAFPTSTFFGIPSAANYSPDLSGGLFGGHIGYNYQFQNWVVGAEFAYSGSTMKDDVLGPNPLFPKDQFRTEINALMSATGKLGFTWGNALVYAKGGWAWAEATLAGTSGPPGAGVSFSAKGTHSGWTAGGGAEWALSQQVTLGIEYNYYDLGAADYSPTARLGTATFGQIAQTMDSIQLHTILARLNIRLGPWW
jgi:outer membrane immunogenic protein